MTLRAFGRDFSIARWLAAIVTILGVLELIYLLIGNVWLPRRLDELAQRRHWHLQLTDFRTLFPGDLSIKKLSLTGPGVLVTTERVRGRPSVRSLWSATLDFDWLEVKGIEVHGQPLTDAMAALSSNDKTSPRASEQASMASWGGWRVLRVVRANLQFRRLQSAAFRVDGTMDAELRRVRVAEHGLRLRGQVHFVGLHVSPSHLLEEQSPALLSGRFEVSAGSDSESEPADGASLVALRGHLQGTELNLGQLLQGSSGSVARGLRADLDLRWQGFHLAQNSTIGLHARELILEADASPADATRLADVRIALTLPSRASSTASVAPGKISLKIAELELTVRKRRQRFACAVEATLPTLDAPSRLALGPGTLRAQRVAYASASAARIAALNVNLSWAQANWSARDGLRLTAAASVSGDDAETLLDFAEAAPSTRWMMSELRGQAFELGLRLDVEPGRVALRDMTIETGFDKASGTVFLVGADLHGVLVVRRGKLRFGIELTPSGTVLEPNPDPNWLARKRDDLEHLLSPRAGGSLSTNPSNDENARKP